MASDLYESLTKEELKRLHVSLYGHTNSLQKRSIARAVSAKALRREPRTVSARFGSVVAGEADGKSGATHPTMSPRDNAPHSSTAVFRRLSKPPPSFSNTVQQWAAEMGTAVAFPTKAWEVRKRFLVNMTSKAAQQQWVNACEAADVHVFSQLRVCMVSSKAAGTAPRDPSTAKKLTACWCTDIPQLSSRNADGDAAASSDDDDVSRPRKHKVHAAVAHWKLNRIVEQGSSYMFQVCPRSKNRETTLADELNGEYVIPDADYIQREVDAANSRRAKLRIVAALQDPQRGPGASPGLQDPIGEAPPVPTTTSGVEDAAEADGHDQGDDSKDKWNHDEAAYFDSRARESTDSFPFASVEVAVKENNMMELKVHMSDAMVRYLLRAAKDDEPGSRSSFAFQTEAMCIGPDCWLGVSGLWKRKVVWFLRDPRNPQVIDSIAVDGFCWERRWKDEAGRPTDPFQCTKCGNIRRRENVAYSSLHSTTIRRGKYLCLVCGEKVVHVSLTQLSHRLKPRWDPTSGKPLSKDMCAAQGVLDLSALSYAPQKSSIKRSGAPHSDKM